jgi:tetratricopeptide (TPR) repeat protein
MSTRIIPVRIFPILLAIVAGTLDGAAAAQARDPDEAPPAAATPRQRLAVEIMRAAVSVASTAPLTADAIDLAVTLADEAVALDPESTAAWRLLLKAATLAERTDLQTKAVERLVQLDPTDETVRLQRLNLALNRYQTAAERVAAYERLLVDENIPGIGEAIASRLALDLALLKQRNGDIEGFSRWLTRALVLDRSNRTAAAIAAGFFRANVSNPAGEAELLVNLFLADPTDIGTQLDLAQLLLDHGAYRGAFRMYTMATGGLTANQTPPSNDLLADFAIAQWAQGDADGALITIERRQMELDEAMRLSEAAKNRELTRADLAKIKSPLHPTLAAVTAVIKSARGDADAPQAVAAAVTAYEDGIGRMTSATPPVPPERVAERQLEIAWIALWLGADSAKPLALVAAADATVPLTDQARRRFEGWKALKDGETDRAIETFTPLAPDDPASAVGLALALQQAGRTRDAARELLALNRAQPGSMIGIWAANELARVLGQRVPLSEDASAMERLIASIQPALDRSVREPSMAVTLRLTPLSPNPGPYEPVMLRVDVTNNSTLPLAIDPAGPLRPQVFVIPTINTATPLGIEPLPVIVDLDSRLRLMPRQTVTTEVDLRTHPLGDLLNVMAVRGGLLKLAAYSNFVANADGSIMPGLYGMEVQAPIIRIDGVRQDDGWLERAIAKMSDVHASPSDLAVTMALLYSEVAHASVDRDTTPERRELLRAADSALPDAFARLEPTWQAWLLCLLPAPIKSKQAILSMARKSEAREVRLAYLLFHVTGPNDPMLDAVRRSDDASLRVVAERVAQAAAQAATAPDAATAPATRPGPSTRPALPPASTSPSPQ